MNNILTSGGLNNNLNENTLNERLPNANENKDEQRPKRTVAANADAKIKLTKMTNICYRLLCCGECK